MTTFIKLRDQLRSIVIEHEVIAERLTKGIVAFIALMLLSHSFGYADALTKVWLIISLAILCAFLPQNGLAIVFIAYLTINLASLSVDVALMLLLLVGVSYLVCGFYGCKRNRNIIFVGVFQQLQIPYAVVMETGLMGGINEVASISCGSVIAFYLRVVRENSSSFLDENASISAADLVMNQMLGSYMFYFYVIAMVGMFLVIYNIKCRDINNSWLIASAAGVLTEVIILLAGYLFTDTSSKMVPLLIGSAIVLLFGMGMSFFMRDLDYSRVEKVQFEDDEYYYYVTAVPKIRIAKEQIQVKKITEDQVRSEVADTAGENKES